MTILLSLLFLLFLYRQWKRNHKDDDSPSYTPSHLDENGHLVFDDDEVEDVPKKHRNLAQKIEDMDPPRHADGRPYKCYPID